VGEGELKGTVLAVSLSERKGTRKRQVDQGRLVEDWGFEGDAHAGKWHRQVSLLSTNSFEKARGWGLQVGYGDFAENLAVSGFEVAKLPVGTRLQVGTEAVLEITQIGKKCHVGCEISKLVGRCVMPLEGVFTRVVRGGLVRTEDEIEFPEMEDKKGMVPDTPHFEELPLLQAVPPDGEVSRRPSRVSMWEEIRVTGF
jgi:MOSC domain-containing protein YiiM